MLCCADVVAAVCALASRPTHSPNIRRMPHSIHPTHAHTCAQIGPTSYFSEGWNRFDFFVVCLSIPGVVIDYATTKELKWLPLIRVLRVTRVFRLIPHAKGLRTLLQTLVWSLPALFNVGSVLFLFMFIYAVIGMNLWGNVVYGGELSRHANFSNFPMSMLLLFRWVAFWINRKHALGRIEWCT